MRVLHARVQAEAAGRRETMRGIADQEHAPVPEIRRHLPAHAPDRTVQQRHVEIGHADMSADDLDHLRVGPRPRPLVLLPADLDEGKPAVLAVGVQDAGTRRHARLVGIDHIAGRFARQRKVREVAFPIFVQDHRERRRPFHLDAGVAPRPAAGAVAGEQIFGVPMLGAAGVDRADLADHAILDLLEADELGREMYLHQVGVLDDFIDLLLDRILRHQRFP